MAEITYTITAKSGSKSTGKLKWAAKGLESDAISGPYGEGSLPTGTYKALRSKLLDKQPSDSNGAYCDTNNKCWLQALAPDFETDRTELGIHPDGNVPGTQGCIGIRAADTKKWYDAF